MSENVEGPVAEGCAVCGEVHPLMFVHSKCCNCHWELVHNTVTGHYQLVCEVCDRVAVEGSHIVFVKDG